jgi:hypothetical protein
MEHQAVKTYGGPRHNTEVSGQLHVAPTALLPGNEPLVPIGQEAGWAPELVWMLWSRWSPIYPSNNQTPAVQAIDRRYTDLATPNSGSILN